jgi:hypothetical protein
VRTYVIIDEANNSTECVQTFTYNVDDNNPVITGTPNAITVCDIAEVNSYDSVTELVSGDPGITSITDNASNDCGLDPIVTFSDAVAGNVITRTYTVYDQCGNTATVNQTITILQEVNISIDIPEFCDPAGANNLDVSEFTVITDGNGNPLTPQNGTLSGSGYAALFTGLNAPSISAAGVITVPASVTPGIYDFTYTHIVNSGSTNCPQVENFSLIIVNEMTLTAAGSCLCNGSNNRAVELGDITGGQAPFTVYYSGGGLDTDGDGIADDTDGAAVFAAAGDFDNVNIILNDGEVSWDITVVDASGCTASQSGSCAEFLDVPQWVLPVSPACFTDGSFEITLSNDYDFDNGDITIEKATGVPGTNYPLFNAAGLGDVFVVQEDNERIRVFPENLIGDDIRYAGIYEITLTIPADENTNCEELTVITQVTLYPSLNACFDLPG